MKPTKTTAIISAASAMALIAGCGSTAEPTADASEFDSADALFQAVDQSADCDPDAPPAPDLILPPGDMIGESKMCTSTVMVTWFKDQPAMEDAVKRLFPPEAHGGISFDVAGGGNWTVADLTDVAVGAEVPATDVDIEKVASDLGGSMIFRE